MCADNNTIILESSIFGTIVGNTKKVNTKINICKKEKKNILSDEEHKKKLETKQKRKKEKKIRRTEKKSKISDIDIIKFYYKDNKDYLKNEKSIKNVYLSYSDYVLTNYTKSTDKESNEPINEYKFRVHIRKNGYCNSCNLLQSSPDKWCNKCKKNNGIIKDKKEKYI
jgi:hypothetical protein